LWKWWWWWLGQQARKENLSHKKWRLLDIINIIACFLKEKFKLTGCGFSG
jgi:hypothetical protein